MQGDNDSLVPVSSSKYVYDSVKTKNKRLIILEGVTHDIFRDINKEKIFKLVEKFLKR